MAMRPLCVIPARRGSKRLPLKTILPLAGRPMLAYTIEAAIDSQVFDAVYVSTEAREIGQIAQSSGARFAQRRESLAGDLVSATEVCLDLEQQLSKSGEAYDAIVCLQPTSPLRSGSDIRESWQHFVDGKADFLVSATPIDPHYFHWAIQESSQGWAMYFGDK